VITLAVIGHGSGHAGPFGRPPVAFAQASSAVSFSGATYVITENQKPGTAEWKLTNRSLTSGAIEGFASLTSVPRGGTIRLFVNTAAPSYTIDIFRMGYYGGTGGRRMMASVTRTGRVQPACQEDALGTIECPWIDPYTLTIPNTSDRTNWMSGIYFVKLTESVTGKQSYITFTVRDDTRAADLIFVQAVTTYQAYNVWGGKSLYGTIADRDDHSNAAHRVSFNRPYYGEGTDGTGQAKGHETEMATWLEKEGYDVSYATSVDLDADPNLLLSHRAYLSVGHDEYWSKPMFDNAERARDSGVSLGFFSGNSIYWQVRFEPSALDGAPHRNVVGYKSDWREDPMLAIDPTQVTGRWRDSPINRSQDRLMGVLFVTQARPAMVIEDASHWAFTGTGLRNGDVLTEPGGVAFLGYEVDQMGAFSPPNTKRLAHSPATARAANFSDVTIYRAPSGATVFATGSIGWSDQVPAIQQMTRNVLARLIANQFVDSEPVRPALPAPFVATDIGAVGRPGFVALSGPNSFRLNGAGGPNSGSDALYYVYQQLPGNGEIVARLKSLQKFDSTRAGLMIRESLAPGARYVALTSNPSETSAGEAVDFQVRDVVGTRRRGLATVAQRHPAWMKLRRTGDTFESFVSGDGTLWTPVGSFVLALPAGALIGISVNSAQTGIWATADFDNVSVTGGGTGGDTTPPDVVVTAPAAGAIVSGSVTVRATATDNAGVAGVQFRVDGTALGSEDTSAPYEVPWNTTLLANGSHALSAEARDLAGNRRTATITVTVSNTPGTLPPGFTYSDVGAVGPAGQASFSSGTYTVNAGGTELWGGSDGFGWVHRSWTGDGDLVARVTSATLPSGATYAQAGIMFRESDAPNAMHASVVIGTDAKLKFRKRTSPGGSTLSEGPSAGTTPIPRWLKLTRRGNTFAAYYSSDGTSWTPIPTTTPTVALSSTVQVGIFALRNSGVGTTRATLSNVSLSSPGMAPWSDADVGAVGTAGSSTFSSSSFRISGGGTDIWGSSDAFHFVYRQWSGNGTFVARLASLTNPAGSTFSMGAIMFRESLDADSRHASVMVTSDGKAKFRRRTSTGGSTGSNGPSAGSTTIPRWLKLVRNGNSFTSFLSANGVDWTPVYVATDVTLPDTVYVGMLVLRNGGSALAIGTFENVSLAP
jgi:regulation of enolase protein 1 (concanavalin A-like superfamily)